jgi:hypothetical protein
LVANTPFDNNEKRMKEVSLCNVPIVYLTLASLHLVVINRGQCYLYSICVASSGAQIYATRVTQLTSRRIGVRASSRALHKQGLVKHLKTDGGIILCGLAS